MRLPTADQGLNIVISGVQSDAHTWNLVFLQLVLEEMGHTVTNLGPCVPDQLLADECAERCPDLIVLSSVNGHGFQDGMRSIQQLRARAELINTPVVIGGKLGLTGPVGATERATALAQAGFDAVFGEHDPVMAAASRLPCAELPPGQGIGPFRRLIEYLSVAVPC